MPWDRSTDHVTSEMSALGQLPTPAINAVCTSCTLALDIRCTILRINISYCHYFRTIISFLFTLKLWRICVRGLTGQWRRAGSFLFFVQSRSTSHLRNGSFSFILYYCSHRLTQRYVLKTLIGRKEIERSHKATAVAHSEVY